MHGWLSQPSPLQSLAQEVDTIYTYEMKKIATKIVASQQEFLILDQSFHF
jgi:hypothetical protein